MRGAGIGLLKGVVVLLVVRHCIHVSYHLSYPTPTHLLKKVSRVEISRGVVWWLAKRWRSLLLAPIRKQIQILSSMSVHVTLLTSLLGHPSFHPDITVIQITARMSSKEKEPLLHSWIITLGRPPTADEFSMCLRVLDSKSYERVTNIPDPDEAWKSLVGRLIPHVLMDQRRAPRASWSLKESKYGKPYIVSQCILSCPPLFTVSYVSLMSCCFPMCATSCFSRYVDCYATFCSRSLMSPTSQFIIPLSLWFCVAGRTTEMTKKRLVTISHMLTISSAWHAR
ncbi:hypothetical protein ACGC1H_004062 [Rhizoctonia solani]